MDSYSPQIRKVIKNLRKLPSVGAKTAEKMTFSITTMTDKEVEEFAASLLALKRELHTCPSCQNLTNEDICPICASTFRNKKVIMVVENPRDAETFERLGSYNGVYHILYGLISQQNRISIQDIRVRELIERLKDDVEEVILALSPTYDGLITMQEIKKLLVNTGIKVSELAHGIPMDSGIENVDMGTLERALTGRVAN